MLTKSFLAGISLVFAIAALPAYGLDQRLFLLENCFECHNPENAEGGLDLSSLARDYSDVGVLSRWIRVHDRVVAGEMPPNAPAAVDAVDQRTLFTNALAEDITAFLDAKTVRGGRVALRRLTRAEYERSLHELTGVNLPLAHLLPIDPKVGGFDRVADGQPLSPVSMEKYLEVATIALETAFEAALAPVASPPPKVINLEGLLEETPWFYGDSPDRRGELAVRWNFFALNKAGGRFFGRLPATRVDRSGRYRIVVRARAVHPRDGHVWGTLTRGPAVSEQPQLNWIGLLDATVEPQEFIFETWMERGEMLLLRPDDRTTAFRGRVREGNRLVMSGGRTPESEQVPGIGMEWIRMELLPNTLPSDAVKQRLFGSPDLPRKQDQSELKSLMAAFARRAFRRPLEASDIQPLIELALSEHTRGTSPLEALRDGYVAILCSPRFLYLDEPVGKLDEFALANRLSFFLTGHPPDDPLRETARMGNLSHSATLRQEVDRLLNHPNSRVFIEDFAGQWLRLDEIDFTEPDAVLYPDFDQVLKHSMLAETHAFLRSLIDENLSVTNLVDADFIWLNGRLAHHYQLDVPIAGLSIQRVSLPANSPRGGLLTQASVLKVTANGTTTSPVTRGVFVQDRILGEPIPPPPANVPALEPDIRGVKTLRDQLDKHRELKQCSTCHDRLDPPGLALENFDVIGAWRDRYRVLAAADASARVVDGPAVEAAGTTINGFDFQDIRQFKRLSLREPTKLARNFVEKLVVYATGAEISFADRQEIASIVQRAAPSNFGIRTLIHEVVQSPLFRNK